LDFLAGSEYKTICYLKSDGVITCNLDRPETVEKVYGPSIETIEDSCDCGIATSETAVHALRVHDKWDNPRKSHSSYESHESYPSHSDFDTHTTHTTYSFY
jgi:hypothetical protein